MYAGMQRARQADRQVCRFAAGLQVCSRFAADLQIRGHADMHSYAAAQLRSCAATLLRKWAGRQVGRSVIVSLKGSNCSLFEESRKFGTVCH